MILTIVILFGLMLALLFVNVPLVVAIGLPTVIVMLIDGMNPLVYAQRVFMAVDSFPLMGIPFFMLAGKIMEIGGMSKRIVRLADCLVGWMVGGLAHVVIVASAFFGALSGSGPATTAAIGSITIPEMKEKGYPADFISGLQSVSGTLGIIIPPSIPLIIYGISSGTPIGELFMAGIVPGIFISICLMVVVYMQANKKKY
jgi:C4-dicarboxylate transporter DctM subunit